MPRALIAAPSARVDVQSKPQPEREPDYPAAASSGPSACLRALAAMPGNRVRAIVLPKPADPACTVDDPVVVEALAVALRGALDPIAFDPPVTLDCAMATVLGRWLDIGLQPLAQGHFQKDVARLRVGGGHECRRRNRAASGTMSEHAQGLALDIFAVTLGREAGSALAVSVEKPSGDAQMRFLTAIRQSACGAFTTVLGPGSDPAHANHIHVDIQSRRSAATRFCQ